MSPEKTLYGFCDFSTPEGLESHTALTQCAQRNKKSITVKILLQIAQPPRQKKRTCQFLDSAFLPTPRLTGKSGKEPRMGSCPQACEGAKIAFSLETYRIRETG